MFRLSLIVGLVVAISGCSSNRWRAKTLENISTPESKVFEIDHTLFGKHLKVTKYRLSNGLKVILMEDHSVPILAYQTWFNVGSRNERKGITGISHFFEHLMFKETKNHKEGEYDRILEGVGGQINAGTWIDWTFYRANVPSNALDKVVELESDRMQNMIINEAQVNSEREVVINERRFRVDNSPQGSMYETLYKTAYTVHPHRWPVIGWMEDIKAITIEECREFYKTYYSPNNATIVVVGDIQPIETLKLINDAYGKIPASDIPPENLPVEPPQKAEKRVVLEKPIPAEKLLVGYHLPNAHHKDFPALEVLSSVLFDGMSSRLYRRLITNEQIASQASGWVNELKSPGLYVVDISMRPNESAKKAEKALYEELDRLIQEDVPEDELDKVKTRIESSFWRHFTTVGSKARSLGYYETLSGDYRQLFEAIPELKKVTASDIRRVARIYFSKDNRTVVTGVPQKGNPS